MKVLDFAPYIYDKGHPEFEKNKTGFGMMVRRICKKTAESCEVSLLTHALTSGYEADGFKVLPHRKKDVLKDFLYIFPAVFFSLSQKGVTLKTKIRYVYYYLSVGSFKRFYKALKPDVVHVHGATVTSLPIIKYCLKKKIPYVLTLHGKVNDWKWGTVPEADMASERFVFSESPFVTVIGSGIKKRLCEITGRSPENVFVVSNGTDTKKTSSAELNLREKYNIDKTRKIFLSVGNLSPWKNQVQTLRALGTMTEEERKKLFFVFAGNDTTGGLFDKEVEKQGVADCIAKVGFVDSSVIPAYYEQADYVVLASLEEGFGLSIIEGYSKGKPGLMFSDVDAAYDLYDERALKLVEKREDEAFAASVLSMLETSWDSSYIKTFSERFSLEKMAKEYIDVYSKVIDNKG